MSTCHVRVHPLSVDHTPLLPSKRLPTTARRRCAPLNTGNAHRPATSSSADLPIPTFGIDQHIPERSAYLQSTASDGVAAHRVRLVAHRGDPAADIATPAMCFDPKAIMEQRADAARVTLPPLTELTASISEEHRHQHLQTREAALPEDNRISDLSPFSHDAQAPRSDLQATAIGAGISSSSRSLGHFADATTAPSPQSSSISRSPTSLRPHKHSPVSEHTSLHRAHHNHAPPPPAPKRPGRFAADTSRPRSYSSPHRNKLHNPERRSSLADHSEIDRLLDSLIYVQDINRRLGLSSGRPASPTIFHSPDAVPLLHRKIHVELDRMAEFSQSRAESVAQHLALTVRPSPVQTVRQDDTFQRRSAVMARPSDIRDFDRSWPAHDPTDRAQSSLGHLSLEEHRRDSSYPQHHSTREVAEDGDRSEAGSSGLSMYANHGVPVDSSLRSISRSTSFEHPRAVQHRHYDRSYPDQGVPHGPSPMGSESRLPHDHVSRRTFEQAGSVHSMFPQDHRYAQMEPHDRRKMAGKTMKRVRKRKNEHLQECLGCQAKETPEWRKGPMGPRTLCNACGLLYAKITKRKLQEAEATAKATGRTAEQIVREREESPGAKQASLEALRAELNLANGARQRTAPISFPSSSTQMDCATVDAAVFHNGSSEATRPDPYWAPQRGQSLDMQPSRHAQHYDTTYNQARRAPHDSWAAQGTVDANGLVDRANLRPATSSGLEAFGGTGASVAAGRKWADDPYIESASGPLHSLSDVERFDKFQNASFRGMDHSSESARIAPGHPELQSFPRTSSPAPLSASDFDTRRRSAYASHDERMYAPLPAAAEGARHCRQASPPFGRSSPSPPHRYARQLPPPPPSSRRHHPYL